MSLWKRAIISFVVALVLLAGVVTTNSPLRDATLEVLNGVNTDHADAPKQGDQKGSYWHPKARKREINSLRSQRENITSEQVAYAAPHVKTWTHNFTLTSDMLHRSVAYAGSTVLLRAVVDRLTANESITFVALGGSITNGRGVGFPADFKGSWSKNVFDWIQATWPNAKHQYVNGAASASDVSYFASCVYRHCPVTADVVFLEHSVNTEPGQRALASMERLVRRLLSRAPTARNPLPPAVLMLHWFDNWTGERAVSKKATLFKRPNGLHSNEHRWDSTVEPDFNVVAQYYDIPSLSARNALFHADAANEPGFRCSGFCENWNHPNRHGHALMSDIAISFIMRVATSASARADSGSNSKHARRSHQDHQLPAALMVPGNDFLEERCYIGKTFRAMVKRGRGFEFVLVDPEQADKRNHKPGYLSQRAGSVLEVDLRTEGGSFAVAYLRSYERYMGQGQVECEGCACSPHNTTLSGWHDSHSSPMMRTRIQVVHPTGGGKEQTECMVRITHVARAENTNGYSKFKILGLIKTPPRRSSYIVDSNETRADGREAEGARDERKDDLV